MAVKQAIERSTALRRIFTPSRAGLRPLVKVTNVPMVDLATKIMLGKTLKELGYGTGVYPEGDYVAVKVRCHHK